MTELTRLVGQVVAVHDLDAAVVDFERIGFVFCDRSSRPDWGIDTAMVAFPDGSYFELVASIDRTKEIGATVGGFLDKRGEGLYLAVIEVPDVAAAHSELVAAGVGVVGPPVPAPEARGIACDLLWLKPRSTGGAFVQLLAYRGGRHYEEQQTSWARGLFNLAIAVADLDQAVESFERIGLRVSDRSSREDWGLTTATFHLREASSIELVSASDASRPAGAAVAKFLAAHGGGHYMTVIEVPDVDAVFARLVSAGVETLGPPTLSPPESPWPLAKQLWVRPSSSHGAFVEFLSFVPTQSDDVAR